MEVLMEIIVDLMTDKLGDKVFFPNKPKWLRILLTVLIGLFVTCLFALGASYSERSVMLFICWI